MKLRGESSTRTVGPDQDVHGRMQLLPPPTSRCWPGPMCGHALEQEVLPPHISWQRKMLFNTQQADFRCTLPQTLAGSQQPAVLVALKYWHTRSAPQQNVLRPLPLNIDVE